MSAVAVIGGGLAGITAALACADGGCQVTLFEAKPRLGGLTHSFRRADFDVDNGQHVFLRCCTSYRRLLHRLGVADQVRLQERLDIPVRMPGEARESRLRRGGMPAPLHLSGALMRYRFLSPAQKIRAVRAAMALGRLDPRDPAVDARTFGDWLTEQGQDATTVDALWNLIGVATLNASVDNSSLALAATVFQTGLLEDAGAGDIGWSLVPLQRLHGDAAAAALHSAGAHVRTGTKVEAIEPRGPHWRIGARGEETMVDCVVLAVPPPAAEHLAPPDGIDLAPGWSERIGSAPIVNVHVVLDRTVMREPFLAGVGTPIQWVFDRTASSGRTTGQYLAVSVSAADAFVDLPVSALREQLLPCLSALLPAVAGAEVLDFFVTRERDATFRPAPGIAALRPPTLTRLPGLLLAGAWTDTGWPATMEGAVRSGESAARAAIASANPRPRKPPEPESEQRSESQSEPGSVRPVAPEVAA